MPRARLTQREMLLRKRIAKRNLMLKKASVVGFKRPEGFPDRAEQAE